MGAHQQKPPLSKSTTPNHDPSSPGKVRKRVCKACDRCRLKKTKCDGTNPCGRCHSDNAICVFGMRRKVPDKVYPKGYVEMLEQQQAQLVTALRKMYKQVKNEGLWHGKPLKENANGNPLTHDILESLGVLRSVATDDMATNPPKFEEDLEVLQERFRERRPSSPESADYWRPRANSASSTAFTASENTELSESPFNSNLDGSDSNNAFHPPESPISRCSPPTPTSLSPNHLRLGESREERNRKLHISLQEGMDPPLPGCKQTALDISGLVVGESGSNRRLPRDGTSWPYPLSLPERSHPNFSMKGMSNTGTATPSVSSFDGNLPLLGTFPNFSSDIPTPTSPSSIQSPLMPEFEMPNFAMDSTTKTQAEDEAAMEQDFKTFIASSEIP